MKILLDTHTLLWMLNADHRLSDSGKDIILDDKNELFFSVASYWEICIKKSLGKLKLKKNWEKIFNQELIYNGIRWIQIEPVHCLKVINLPFHHRDPFDRILIAQAIIGKMQILTKDKHIPRYNVKSIW